MSARRKTASKLKVVPAKSEEGTYPGTVRDLIAVLQTCDPDAIVVPRHDGQRCEWLEICQVKQIWLSGARMKGSYVELDVQLVRTIKL